MSLADRWSFDDQQQQYEIIVEEDGVERTVTLDEWLKEKE